MQYKLTDTSVIQITETSGTIQNISNSTVEISNSADFTDSFLLYPLNKVFFTEQLYIRACEPTAQIIEVNVAPFVVSGSGNSSSIAADSFATRADFDSVISGVEDSIIAVRADLDSVGWQQYDDDFFTYGKIYKNIAPYVKIGGVNSAPSIDDKSVSIPASVIEEEQVTLTANRYEFIFGAACDLNFDCKNSTLKTGAGNSSIVGNGKNQVYYFLGNDTITGFSQANDKLGADFTTAISDTVDLSGNATLTFTTGESVSSVVLESINSGILNVVMDKYSAEYEIGVGLNTDFVINTETNITISSIAKSKLINLGTNVDVELSNFDVDNRGSNVTINGGTGADTITNSGSNVTINGGTGNDKIYLDNSSSAFVSVGAGYDSIFVNAKNQNQTYAFGTNDAHTYIFDLKTGDSLLFTDTEGNSSLAGDITEEGLVFNFGDTKVVIKGALKDGLESTSISNYKEIAAGTEINIEKIIGGTTTSEKYVVPRKIVGTNGDNNITFGNSIVNIGSDGESDNYEIYAKAGNDSIVSNGTGVSIYAGTGNDTISIVGKAKSNIIISETGNDLVYGNGGGHTYVYNSGDGNDTILGFSSADVLSIVGGEYEYASVESGYFGVSIGSYKIYLKGERKSEEEIASLAAEHTILDEYDTIKGGTILNIVDGVHETVEVEKLIVGTNLAESIIIDKEHEGYKILALNSNDTIINYADKVSINAGSANDLVKLESGSFVTVNSFYGNDTIEVSHGSKDKHLFEIALGEGVNVINGINENDTIKVRGAWDFSTGTYGSEVSIQSVAFGTALESDTLILTLNDNSTRIKIKESDGVSQYRRIGKKHNEGCTAEYFWLQKNDDVAEKLYVPFIIKLTGAVAETLTATDSTAIIIGDDSAQTITNQGADYVSIVGGAGTDSVRIESGVNNTIYTGIGDDTIELVNSGHFIQYNLNDGKDTIYGWDNGDTLQLNGYGTFSTLMNGTTFGVQFGNYNITFKDINGDDILPETLVKITGNQIINNATLTSEYDYNSTTGIFTLAVPRLLKGTGGNDKGSKTLINDKDRYTIDAIGGNDSVINSGDYVSISAGAGNDTVNNQGDYVTIEGGAGTEVIYNSGLNVSINGGDGADLVSIFGTAANCTILCGAGNDTIYSNGTGNVFLFSGNVSEGDNVLSGFSNNDTIYIESSNATVTDSVVGGSPQLTLSEDSISTTILLKDFSGNSFKYVQGAATAAKDYTLSGG